MKLTLRITGLMIALCYWGSFRLMAYTPISVAYSQNGKQIALVEMEGNNQYVLQLFDTNTGKNRISIPVKQGSYPILRFDHKDHAVYALRLFGSPTRGVLNQICRYEIREKELRCYKENVPKLFEYKFGENRLITSSLYYNSESNDSGSYTLDGKTLQPIEKLDSGTFKKATALALHPVSSLIAAATLSDIAVYDLEKRTEIKRWPVHRTASTFDEIYNISWSRNGSHIAAGYSDGVVKVWNWQNGTLVKAIHTGFSGYVVPIYLPDGGSLMAGDQMTGSFHLYRFPDYGLQNSYPMQCGIADIHSNTEDFGPEKSPQRFAVSPDSLKCAVTCKKSFKEVTFHDIRGNSIPQLTVVSPKAFSNVNPRTPLMLSATATDAEDGNLSQAIQWISSIERELGSGRAIQVSLEKGGRHILTAMARDSKGGTGIRQIIINVNRHPQISEFSWEEQGKGKVMFFTTLSDADNNLDKRTIDFGDGERIVNWPVKDRPVHHYRRKGTYDVTLSGVDKLGLEIRKVKKISIRSVN